MREQTATNSPRRVNPSLLLAEIGVRSSALSHLMDSARELAELGKAEAVSPGLFAEIAAQAEAIAELAHRGAAPGVTGGP